MISYKEGVGGVIGLEDADSLALTPDGDFLYVGSSENASLTVFGRESDGTLSYVDTYVHTTNTIDGLLGISGIAISNNNQHLYVAGRFEASVAHYEIEPDGRLELIDAVANGDVNVEGLGGAKSLEITPDGEHIIVASSNQL